jgi:hypothetical protein
MEPCIEPTFFQTLGWRSPRLESFRVEAIILSKVWLTDSGSADARRTIVHVIISCLCLFLAPRSPFLQAQRSCLSRGLQRDTAQVSIARARSDMSKCSARLHSIMCSRERALKAALASWAEITALPNVMEPAEVHG